MKKHSVKKAIAHILVMTVLLTAVFYFPLVSEAAQTPGLNNGGVYNIINSGSGKYLNVNSGSTNNTDNVNVNQWAPDGTNEQQFKLEYRSGSDSYWLRAMCSSNGTNRVVEVYRPSASVPAQSGNNVAVWTPSTQYDNDHYWKIVSVGNNLFKIVLRSNTNLALTSYGNGNGGTGTSSTSAGNVFVATYTGSNANQHWSFQASSSAVGQTQGVTSGEIYYIQSVHSNKYIDVAGGGTSNTTNIHQWAYAGVVNQRWQITYVGNGDYTIMDMNSCSLLSICGSLSGATVNAWIWHNDGTNGQKFKIRKNSDGTYTFLSKCSNYQMALDIDRGPSSNYGQDNAANIQQWYDANTDNQKWVLVPVTTSFQSQGYLDSVSSTTIAGWARNAYSNDRYRVHVETKNSSGTIVKTATVTANQYRGDVASGGYGDGYCGFSYTTNWSGMASGTYTVSAYLLNGAAKHQLIGSPKTYFHNSYEQMRYGISVQNNYKANCQMGASGNYSSFKAYTDYIDTLLSQEMSRRFYYVGDTSWANDFKNKTLSGSTHSYTNMDDVDMMIYTGHGYPKGKNYCGGGFQYNSLHFGTTNSSTDHSLNQGATASANFTTQDASYFGYNTRTKWLVAYTCNFLNTNNGSQSDVFEMLNRGGRIILGYGTKTYVTPREGEQFAATVVAGNHILDCFIDSAVRWQDHGTNFDYSKKKVRCLFYGASEYWNSSTDTIYSYDETIPRSLIYLISYDVNMRSPIDFAY